LRQSCGFFAAVKNIFAGGYFGCFTFSVEWLRNRGENFRLSKTHSKRMRFADVFDFWKVFEKDIQITGKNKDQDARR